MLCIKDFRTTTKSYILTLQDSETNELSEKNYDINSDKFNGRTWAGFQMLDDINDGKYQLSLDINANRKTAALLETITQFKRERYVVVDFNMFDSYRDSDFSKKYYGYCHDKDYNIIYIADYKTKGFSVQLVTVKETANVKDENYDAIIKNHKKIIKKTGKFNGVKLRKFNRVQFLALMLITRRRINVSQL